MFAPQGKNPKELKQKIIQVCCPILLIYILLLQPYFFCPLLLPFNFFQHIYIHSPIHLFLSPTISHIFSIHFLTLHSLIDSSAKFFQIQIRKDYYEDNINAGPQSKILDGDVSWDEQRVRVNSCVLHFMCSQYNDCNSM